MWEQVTMAGDRASEVVARGMEAAGYGEALGSLFPPPV